MITVKTNESRLPVPSPRAPEASATNKPFSDNPAKGADAAVAAMAKRKPFNKANPNPEAASPEALALRAAMPLQGKAAAADIKSNKHPTPAEVVALTSLAASMSVADLKWQIANAAQCGITTPAAVKIFEAALKAKAKAKAKASVPADVEAEEAIRAADHFEATLLVEGAHVHESRKTLELAREAGKLLEGKYQNSKLSLIYAVTSDGKSVLVPRDFNPSNPGVSSMQVATTSTTTARKPAAPVKSKGKAGTPAKKATGKGKGAAKPAAARVAKAPAGKRTGKAAGAKAGTSKSDLVHKMLTAPKGATREELSKATGWPSVNLKVAAARASMKLVETDGRFRLV